MPLQVWAPGLTCRPLTDRIPALPQQGLEGPEHSYVSRFMERPGVHLERNGKTEMAKPRAPAAVRAAAIQQQQQQQQGAVSNRDYHEPLR